MSVEFAESSPPHQYVGIQFSPPSDPTWRYWPACFRKSFFSKRQFLQGLISDSSRFTSVWLLVCWLGVLQVLNHLKFRDRGCQDFKNWRGCKGKCCNCNYLIFWKILGSSSFCRVLSFFRRSGRVTRDVFLCRGSLENYLFIPPGR